MGDEARRQSGRLLTQTFRNAVLIEIRAGLTFERAEVRSAEEEDQT